MFNSRSGVVLATGVDGDWAFSDYAGTRGEMGHVEGGGKLVLPQTDITVQRCKSMQRMQR
jgi:hypothetical protein